MLKWLLSLTVVGFSTDTYAVVYTDPEEVCELAKKGDGAWFDDIGMLRCLELDVEVIDLREEREIIELQLKSALREITRHEKLDEAQADMMTVLRNQRTIDQSRIGALEDEINVWYRNPWIIGAIGVLVGGAAVGVTVLAVSVN